MRRAPWQAEPGRRVPRSCFLPDDDSLELMAGVHGNNERISLESFRLNCQMVYEITRRMCVIGS